MRKITLETLARDPKKYVDKNICVEGIVVPGSFKFKLSERGINRKTLEPNRDYNGKFTICSEKDKDGKRNHLPVCYSIPEEDANWDRFSFYEIEFSQGKKVMVVSSFKELEDTHYLQFNMGDEEHKVVTPWKRI